jgi:hypothetical protein
VRNMDRFLSVFERFLPVKCVLNVNLAQQRRGAALKEAFCYLIYSRLTLCQRIGSVMPSE